MKKILLSISCIFYLLITQAQAPTIQWQKTIGGSSNDFLHSIEQTSDGGYITGGYSTSNMSGDKTENSNGNQDYWVTKIDAAGVVQWENTIGGTISDYLYSLELTSDGGYILGGSSWSTISGDKTEVSQGRDDYWVVKLDALGVVQWDKAVGGSGGDVLRSIKQTSDGGYILGGESWSTISGDKTENSQGDEDYWVVKLDAVGVLQWQNTIGGSNDDKLHSVEQASDGGYLLGGYSSSNISGDKTEVSHGSNDYWVVKLDTMGILQWQNTIGGSSNDRLYSVKLTSDGGYILGGESFSNISGDKTDNSNGYSDCWVVKLDVAGVIQWQNTIGGSANEYLYSIGQTSDGGYVLGASSGSSISGDKTENSQGATDYWVVKLAGPILWTGTTSTDWHTATNWSNDLVPSNTDMITIPDVSGTSGNFPIITSTTNVGVVTVSANANLTISGAGLVLESVFTNNGTVSILSDAFLDDFTNAAASYVGDLTVEKLITLGSGLGQRMFGSPVNNGVVAGLDNSYASASTGQVVMSNCASLQVDVGSPYNNLFAWHEDAASPNTCEFEAWWAMNDATPLENGRGYSGWIQDNQTISFTGTPNTGNINYGGTLTNSNSGLVNKDGWHVLSNPYPSAINANSLTTTGWQSLSHYQATSGAYGGTFQPILPAQNLSVMQGFVAKVSTGSPTQAAFTNAMRVAGNLTFLSTASWFTSKLDIEITGANGSDISYLYFNDAATSSFDNQWDCEKRESDMGKPTIFTTINGLQASLNGNASNALGTEKYSLGLKPGTNGTFSLSFNGQVTFPANTTIYLKDLQEDVVHNIADGDYTFTANTTDTEERFEIIFIDDVELQTTAVDCEGNIGSVSLLNTNSINRTYELFLNNSEIASNNLINLNENLNEGNYQLKVYDQYGGMQVYDVIITEKENIIAAFTVSNNELFTGELLDLNCLTSNYTNMEWLINNSVVSNVNNLTYAFQAAGIYEVKMQVSNEDCDDFKTETIEVINKTTGIANQISLDKILVYTKDNSVIIDLSNADLKGQTKVEIYDLLGQLILQKVDIKTIERIELKNQARGYYLVNIINQKEKTTKKIIIK